MKLDDKTLTLVVGLGNWNVTPDALGPKVVSNMMVTRHLLEYLPTRWMKASGLFVPLPRVSWASRG